ncbi:CDP-diacylglycerol--serine O-phosphatidyltransferase [Pseudonocardia sediminis]|uniref:CDP-diacylglycerol--serine O-phosphatidyltransferase n=1 Tax=Pseudonocardia sediminis TaxID=1397368 RepID=A0A4Q7V2T5_PSEST|nr:CDP-diacylglycerol--serine O-phosphatidyltransferase [Pseudonocardia sediminis]RZT88686.1 CDP-diacylglycerol--serine O-phosphatidyltransferase [Pseudonocardia sediminis]
MSPATPRRPEGGYPAGVRLLPNAVTVLNLCAGLSAVYFALGGRFEFAIGSIAAAGLCDALDGGLARLLDASSRIGAELDSLADLVSFGVAPALVIYIWGLQDTRAGWVVALVFAVCMALRLARFNTLIDDDSAPPFAREFFVGVPAPAAAMTAGIPLYLWLHLGPGWWSSPIVVAVWALVTAGLMVSRLPTLSLKTIRVPQRAIAPLLVVICVIVAVLLTVPFLGITIAALLYLALIPYTMYRYRWLSKHPEAWDVPVRQRRAVARAARSARRLGLRPPLRRRVAGRAGAMARGMARRLGNEDRPSSNGIPPASPRRGPTPPRGSRRNLGLRRR